MEAGALTSGSVPSRDDTSLFYHQHDGAAPRMGEMHHASWNGESLTRRQADGPILHLDVEMSFDHVEEFVFILMLVPMEIAFEHAEADPGIVDCRECSIP